MHNSKYNFNYQYIGLSLITGGITGLIVSLFQLGIQSVLKLSLQLLQSVALSWFNSLTYFILLIGLGVITRLCLKFEPHISGSGIPQVAGHLQGELEQNPFKVLINKFIGGLATIGSGLTLGREGPSVQIGSTIGQILGRMSQSPQEIQQLLMAGAAGAGMAAAFNTPISGVLFIIEELFHKTSRQIILCASLVVLTATYTARLILGNHLSIPIGSFDPQQTPNLFILIGLGLMTGLSGVAFNKLIIKGKQVFAKWLAPEWSKTILPYLITGLALILDDRLFGSGGEMMTLAADNNTSIFTLIYFFVAKFSLLLLAFCSGLPGGIFFPLLAIGSLLGNIYGSGMVLLDWMNADAILYLAVVAMAGHFTAIVRAPLTGILLIVEMTGASLPCLLPIGLVSYIAYLVAESLDCPPIYDSLLDNLLKK